MAAFDVFDEWTSYAKRKVLRGRDVDFDSIEKNAKSKIVAVTGIRRSGKSSVLMLLAQRLEKQGQKVGYVNVEDSRLKDVPEVLDEILKWFGDEGFLFLDEVTRAKDWQGWLARNHELLQGKLRLVVSSSLQNLVLPNKPLRGRILPVALFPLSFKEFLAFKEIPVEKTTAGRGRLEKAFTEYLKFGGFPEVALAVEDVDKVAILNSYFKDIVGLDVAEVSGEDVGALDTFGRYVVQSPFFSASKCLNFFKTLGYKIGKEKILRLEKYSEYGYLFFFMPIFAYGLKDRSQYPRKAYCGDVGFYYSTTGKMDMGRIFETVAFLELKRRAGLQMDLCYWKNKDGFEADFVLKQGTRVSDVFQVVYEFSDEKTIKRETRAVSECFGALNPVHFTFLTKDVQEKQVIDGVDVRFVPLMDWLLE